MALSSEDEARLAEAAARLFEIKDAKDRAAALTMAALAAEDNKGAAFDYLSSQIEALEKQDKHTLAADVMSFNTKIGQVRTELSAGLDNNGLTGSKATVLTGVMDDEMLGAASLGITGGVDANGELGDPTLSARWVSPTLINDDNSRLEAVAVAAAGVTIPMTDRPFNGADVSLAAGAVVFDKPTGVAFTGLVSTDAMGKDPALWGRVSGNFYEDENTRLAANLNGGYDTAAGQGNVGAGLFAEHQLDSTNTIYASAGVAVGDPGGENDVMATFNIGATFDVMPTTKVVEKTTMETSPHDISSVVKTVIVPAENKVSVATTVKVEKVESYDFLNLSKKDQQKVIALMAENYQDAHPDTSIKDAKEAILNELAIANYYVDSHGTRSHADDTPVRVEEFVASR